MEWVTSEVEANRLGDDQASGEESNIQFPNLGAKNVETDCGNTTSEERAKEYPGDKLQERNYNCSICNKTFIHSYHLKQHIVVHTGAKPYECEVCGSEFSYSSNLNKHMNIHTGKPFVCEVCGLRFNDSWALKNHVRVHTGEKPFSCNFCDYRCRTKRILEGHLTANATNSSHQPGTQHKASRPAKVLVVGELLEGVTSEVEANRLGDDEASGEESNMQLSTLKEAKAECDKTALEDQAQRYPGDKSRERNYSCGICNKTFIHSSYLKQHMMAHTGDRRHECRVCMYRFKYLGDLNKHMKTHTGKPFVCEVCGLRFNDSWALKNHVRVHTGEKPFSCNFCDYKCRTKRILERHLTANASNRSHQLGTQHKGCRTEKGELVVVVGELLEGVTSEVEANHLGDDQASGEESNMQLSTLQDAEADCVKTTSEVEVQEDPGGKSRERNYSCRICEKTFIYSSRMKEHMMVHTGDKPHECRVCRSKFSNSGNLNKHMKIHTGKPFVCQACGLRFNDSWALKNHVTVHTGEKPFSCNICGYRCRTKRLLERHLTAHATNSSHKPGTQHKVSSSTFENGNLDAEEFQVEGETSEVHADPLSDYLNSHDVTVEQDPVRYPATNQMDSTAQNTDADAGEGSASNELTPKLKKDSKATCDICGVTCNKSYLKTHILIHKGENPYPCNVCGHKFRDSSNLKKHMLIHTGELPHACDMCDYRTSRSETLKAHVRTHTGEKPYACDNCDKRFRVRSDLRRHLCAAPRE